MLTSLFPVFSFNKSKASASGRGDSCYVRDKFEFNKYIKELTDFHWCNQSYRFIGYTWFIIHLDLCLNLRKI